MADLFGHIEFWHWWIAGVLFVCVEILAPGVFFLWLGIAAGVVGLLALIAPSMGWEYQVVIWAVLSVAAAFSARKYFKRHPIETDQPTLNRRGSQYVGRHFTLEQPIVNGAGKIKVDDTIWKAECDTDLPAGSRVKVEAVDGTILKVTAA